MSTFARQQLRAVPLGGSEQPVKVHLIGKLSLKDFVGQLKEEYANAGPRLGWDTTPAWLIRDRAKHKAANKKKDSGKGDDGGAGPTGAALDMTPRTIVLYRPIHILSADKKTKATIDLGGATLLIVSPGVTMENLTITGFGRPGLDWGESHGLVEVSGRGDLLMQDCEVSMKVITPPDALYPAPTKNCGPLLVEKGGRATMDRCTMHSSPLSYGLVARDQGTKVLLEDCKLRDSYHGNVLVCRKARISLLKCEVSGAKEGYGLSAVNSGTTAFCKDTTFTQNSRDNTACFMGARLVLEHCTLEESKKRSGLKVDGEGSSGFDRDSDFQANHERPVHARWGAWASIRGSRYLAGTPATAKTGSHTPIGDVAGEHAYDESLLSLVEGPTTCLIQDPRLGQPEWRYLSSLERPWSARQAVGETVSAVLKRADELAAREVTAAKA